MKIGEEIFVSETLNSKALIRKNRLNRCWLAIFFISLILCGNGRSISLLKYLGGSITSIIVIYIIGFIAMVIYLSSIFSTNEGVGDSIIVDNENIKIKNVPHILPVKITINASPTYNEVDDEKLGNNWLEYNVDEKLFKVEFRIKSKNHETLLRNKVEVLKCHMNITIC